MKHGAKFDLISVDRCITGSLLELGSVFNSFGNFLIGCSDGVVVDGRACFIILSFFTARGSYGKIPDLAKAIEQWAGIKAY